MRIHRSASRRGIGEDAIRHARRRALAVIELDPDSDPPKVLAIGPDRAGNLIEIVWLQLEGGRRAGDPRHADALSICGLVGTESGGAMKKKPARTDTGRVLTDEELDALADEVENADYDLEVLKERRRGRPAMGSGPAAVVPVRLDPELRAALESHAAAADTSTSDVIRAALRRYLKVR